MAVWGIRTGTHDGMTTRRPRGKAEPYDLACALCLAGMMALLLLPLTGSAAVADGDQTEPAWEAYDPETLVPGSKPLVKLPLSFSVEPICYLHLNGARVYDVTLTWDPAGRLLLNGEQIMGPPMNENPEDAFFDRLTEEKAQRQFGNVPLFQNLVDSGRHWREAARVFSGEWKRIKGIVADTYYDARANGAEGRAAIDLAIAAGMEADTLSIFAPPGQMENTGQGVWITAVGYPRFFVSLKREQKPPPFQARTWTESEGRQRATYLYESLTCLRREKPCFIRVGGNGIAASFGETTVAAILEQLDEARRDPARCPKGRLNPGEVKEILAAEGISVAW